MATHVAGGTKKGNEKGGEGNQDLLGELLSCVGRLRAQKGVI